jgi:hypothetical protein
MTERTELKQTKNSFKFIGKVSRIDKDGAFKEEIAKKGKKEGETYRSLRFGLKTSENNEMTIQMYDFEPQEVFLWNNDKKKADKNYKGERMPFDEWEEKQEELREGGTAVLQTRVGLSYGEDGKIESKGLPAFVASQKIYNNLSNNDAVVVEGTIRYSTYENQQGKVVEQKTYTISKVFKLKEVDFESEKFEEVTYFEQEMVFVSATAVKEEDKVFVTGRIIDYYKNFHDTEFVINYSDGMGGKNDDLVKLATAFMKKIKFGDVVNVWGDALNRVVLAEVTDEDEDDDDLASLLGGKQKPKHAQQYVSRTYISEMQIMGIDAWDKKIYKETDFVVDELIEDKKDLASELGGKKKKESNPFADDSDDGDEDLPF